MFTLMHFLKFTELEELLVSLLKTEYKKGMATDIIVNLIQIDY